MHCILIIRVMKTFYLLPFLFIANLLSAQSLIPGIDSNTPDTVIAIPAKPANVDLICLANDSTAYDPLVRTFGPIRSDFSDVLFIPDEINPLTEGIILISHNENNRNLDFSGAGDLKFAGDGGGVTQCRVKRSEDGHWQVVKQNIHGRDHFYRNVNFYPVGGAVNLTDFFKVGNRIFVLEGKSYASNNDLRNGGVNNSLAYRDTSDFIISTGQGPASDRAIKRYQNMGYLIEVDPVKASVIKKHYGVGRISKVAAFSEANIITFASKTEPSLLFQFRKDIFWEDDDLDNIIDNMSLAVYTNQGFKVLNSKPVLVGTDPDTQEDEYWNVQDFDVLVDHVFEQALDSGAVMFSNITSIDFAGAFDFGNKFIICENGMANSVTDPNKIRNGVWADHLKALDEKDGNLDGVFNDQYGRLLTFDLNGNKIEVLKEGDVNFSNPYSFNYMHTGFDDNSGNVANYALLSFGRVDSVEHVSVVTLYKNFLSNSFKVTNPDVMVRTPKSSVFRKGQYVGLKNTDPADDPVGFKNKFTFFTILNNHGSEAGTGPFRNSMVVAVTLNASDKEKFWEIKGTTDPVGIKDYFFPNPVELNSFTVYPNPAQENISFSKKIGISIFHADGSFIKNVEATDFLDISDLSTGMYIIQTTENESFKLFVE